MFDSEPVKIGAPLTEEVIKSLRAGMLVLISGTLLTGRDAAHKRLCDAAAGGEPLPVDLTSQIIYYVGPSPAKPGAVIGSAGPTTAYRMDPFTPTLLKLGLRGMIGKGQRSPEVRQAIKEYGAVYFAAVGGAAALIAKCIKSAEVIAYEDLGPEAMRRLEVLDFPAIVANDMYGNDFYELGVKQYLQRSKRDQGK